MFVTAGRARPQVLVAVPLAIGRRNDWWALLTADHDEGAGFMRLANALAALYPGRSEEKRLLDAMMLAVPR